MPTLTPAALIWAAAGKPTTADATPYVGPCWWCGNPSNGTGRPVKSAVASTFPDANKAAVPSATHVCMPCGWTWSDAVRLPQHILAARLVKKLEKGGLVTYSLTGEPEKLRHLLLPLDDGLIGRWTPGATATLRKPWEAAIKSLKAAPVTIATNVYIDSVPLDRIEVSDDATEKFRSFHHYTDGKIWQPFTDSERLQAREWLLNPPAGEWCCVIGDGKKHAANHYDGRVSYGPDGVQSVYFQGTMVDYLPTDMARWILAAERLSFAGAMSEEIESGRYESRSSDLWAFTFATEAPVVAAMQGGPVIRLVLYLVRGKKDLTETDLWSATNGQERNAAPVPDPVRAIPVPVVAPPPPVRNDPEPAPPKPDREPVRSGARQLSLFG